MAFALKIRNYMINQKKLWENLAQKNSRYYINSDFGHKITEDQFKQSGLESYKKLILNDPLIIKGTTILDFGCGTGRITEFMSKDFKKVYGVDISKTMIATALERLASLENIYLCEIDGIHVPLPDDSTQNVFSYLVFQHIKERAMVEDLFDEIHRILMPNGIFKVLMRSDKQKDMNKWWSGVDYDPDTIKKVYKLLGFKLKKYEMIDKYGYWLWLEK